MKKKAPQKHSNSKQIATAIAMFELGHSYTSIAGVTGLSVAQISHHIKAHGAKKGAATEELIKQTRKELLEKLTSNDGVLDVLVADLNDDIERHKALKRVADTILKNLISGDADMVDMANTQAKGFASITTGLKNLKDIHTKALNNPRLIDLTETGTAGETYVIEEITKEEAEALQRNKSGNMLTQNEEAEVDYNEGDTDDLDV